MGKKMIPARAYLEIPFSLDSCDLPNSIMEALLPHFPVDIMFLPWPVELAAGENQKISFPALPSPWDELSVEKVSYSYSRRDGAIAYVETSELDHSMISLSALYCLAKEGFLVSPNPETSIRAVLKEAGLYGELVKKFSGKV